MIEGSDKSFWNKEKVKRYINIWGIPTNPHLYRGKERMIIPLEYINGRTVLDVGCGMGHFYFALMQYALKRNIVMEYLGVDSSREMLRKAKEFFPDADFRYGNAYKLKEFKSYDTVISISLLIHLYKIEDAITQLWEKTIKRCIFLIPLGENESIEHPEEGLIYHQVAYENLFKILENLENVKRTIIRFWVKRHYFVVLDKGKG